MKCDPFRYGRSTKAFKQWATDQGKPVITEDDAALIEVLHESVFAHKLAVELLSDGVAEGVVRVSYMRMSGGSGVHSNWQTM